jgi:hypothetical protein
VDGAQTGDHEEVIWIADLLVFVAGFMFGLVAASHLIGREIGRALAKEVIGGRIDKDTAVRIMMHFREKK